MTDDLYYRKLESTSTSDLVDILRERDGWITQLEQENAKLKSECRTCVYTDTSCVRSDYSSKNGVCDHYKNVFDENTKLKLKLEALEEQIPWKDIKDKSEVIGKVIKAKEIIKELLQILPKENIEGIYEVTEEECKKWIEEHTKKTWLEERKSCLSVSFSKEVINGYSAGVTEVCKKILEVEHNLEVNSETTEGFVIGKNQLRDIIKDLGVEVWELIN